MLWLHLFDDIVDVLVAKGDGLVTMLLQLVIICCFEVTISDEKKRKKMSLLGPTLSVLKCGALI